MILATLTLVRAQGLRFPHVAETKNGGLIWIETLQNNCDQMKTIRMQSCSVTASAKLCRVKETRFDLYGNPHQKNFETLTKWKQSVLIWQIPPFSGDLTGCILCSAQGWGIPTKPRVGAGLREIAPIRTIGPPCGGWHGPRSWNDQTRRHECNSQPSVESSCSRRPCSYICANALRSGVFRYDEKGSIDRHLRDLQVRSWSSRPVLYGRDKPCEWRISQKIVHCMSLILVKGEAGWYNVARNPAVHEYVLLFSDSRCGALF